jgi:phage terminase large subunit
VYIESLIYETGLSNAELITRMKALNINGSIIADNSEPKSIAEFRSKGFNIIGVKKPLVELRVKEMQSKNLFIMKNDYVLKTELSSYLWELDSNMKPTNVPDKKRFDPHALEGAGYVIWEMKSSAKASGTAVHTKKAHYPKPV